MTGDVFCKIFMDCDYQSSCWVVDYRCQINLISTKAVGCNFKEETGISVLRVGSCEDSS